MRDDIDKRDDDPLYEEGFWAVFWIFAGLITGIITGIIIIVYWLVSHLMGS